MSYSFYINCPDPPSWSDTIGSLEYDDVGVVEGDAIPDDGPIPEETYFHLFRMGLSTRTVEVVWRDDELAVRIMTCSSPEDFELAFSIIRRTAAVCGGEITSEEGETFPADRLGEYHGEEWVEQMVASGPAAVRGIVLEEDDTVTIPGPAGNFFLGPRTLDRLGEEDRDFGDALFDAIREVQWTDPDKWFRAGIMGIMLEGSREKQRLSVWGPGVDYFFPHVDRIAITQTGDDDFLIPYEAITELVPEAEYADEKQLLVPAIPEEEWPDFVEQARQHSTGEV